jgi:hypothetical protein
MSAGGITDINPIYLWYDIFCCLLFTESHHEGRDRHYKWDVLVIIYVETFKADISLYRINKKKFLYLTNLKFGLNRLCYINLHCGMVKHLLPCRICRSFSSHVTLTYHYSIIQHNVNYNVIKIVHKYFKTNYLCQTVYTGKSYNIIL